MSEGVFHFDEEEFKEKKKGLSDDLMFDQEDEDEGMGEFSRESGKENKDEKNLPSDHHIKCVIAQYAKLHYVSKLCYDNLKKLPVVDFRFWKAFFQDTFDRFNSLWQFQQSNRVILEERFNLTRVDVGEIARKIGELYLQYYLRTSDTKYLQNSFKFYEAIRNRQYLRQNRVSGKMGRISKREFDKRLKVKYVHLKCLLKFIVVCLFQNKRKLALTVLEDVSSLIKTLRTVHEQVEWRKIVDEISKFIEGDLLVTVGSNVNIHTYRSPRRPKSCEDLEDLSDRESVPKLEICKAIIVSGNRSQAIKFVDLTFNAFRMFQSLEHEPYVLKTESVLRRLLPRDLKEWKNCGKTYLYLTSFSVVMRLLASCQVYSKQQEVCTLLYLDMNCDKEYNCLVMNDEFSSSLPNNRLHLKDILPFSRMPLFLIIDTDNNFIWDLKEESFQTYFMAIVYREDPENSDFKGRPFSFFMSNPILAFCYFLKVDKTTVAVWREMYDTLLKSFDEAEEMVRKLKSINFVGFMENKFTKNYILRFMFMKVVLLFFKKTEMSNNLESHPKLPKECFELVETNPIFVLVKKFAKILKVDP